MSEGASTADLFAIYRYPVKSLSAEALPRTRLAPGQTIPADRRYAIENGPSGFDPAAPAYLPKARFLMLMRNERLARLETRYDEATQVLTVGLAGRKVARGDLATPEGRAEIGRFFADVAKKVVSIINLATVAALEDILGSAVHPLRFRGNLYVTGWPAWHEFALVGQEIAVGTAARLRIVKRIERCAAINVDPDTGIRDLVIPQALARTFGHTQCGVYAAVVTGGEITVGDRVRADILV